MTKEVLTEHKGIYRVCAVDPTGGTSLQDRWRIRYKEKLNNGKWGSRSNTFDSLDEAVAFKNSLSQISAEDKSADITFKDTFEELMNHKKNIDGLARGTIDGWQNRYFHLEFFSDFKVGYINPKLIDSWIRLLFSDEYKERYWPKSRSTFRHELSLLKQILNYYREYHNSGYIVPIEPRHRKSLLLKNRSSRAAEKIKYLNRHEAAQVIQCAPDEITRDLILLQLRTGMRIGEVAALTFDKIDSSRSVLSVDKHVDWPRRKGAEIQILSGTKGGPSRDLPLSQDCRLMLLKRQNHSKAKTLVFEKDGKVLSYRYIQHRYDLAFKRAGIVGKNGSHTLRHTFAVDFLSETTDHLALQKLLGHSKLEDTLRYGKYLEAKVHSVYGKYSNSAMDLGIPNNKRLEAI
ncbi:site-specific integrase [Bdellovibrio sp.]|uniref:tyrosine-type recombinase/integrase n=1 Tax=Bdellovibrio sp. TaxID=28201 RepID=UPI003221E29E